MSGIQVLSDVFKAGNKLEKTFSPQSKSVSKSSENAASAFAAMFGGFMNSNVESKGQQNTPAGQKFAEKQDAGYSGPSIHNFTNEEESMPGRGEFALAALFSSTLQSELPAGKEANSGTGVSQEAETLTEFNGLLNVQPQTAVNNSLASALSELLSLVSEEASAQSGMTAPQAQGANPGIPESDQYKQLIAKLLSELSGEITKNVSEGDDLSLEMLKSKGLSQETVKVLQGWLTAVNENDMQTSQMNQKGSQALLANLAATELENEEPRLTAKEEKMLEALKRMLGKDNQETDMNQKLKGTPDIKSGGGPEARFALTEELQQGSKAEKTEATGLKAAPDQTLAGIGTSGNIVAVNVADGKSAASPVWEQVANMIREQMLMRQQDLRQLNLQLHPAELGRIQIAMRMENGQLHLQFHASEAATAQLLQGQLSNLRQSLNEQGVDCGMLQMGQNGEEKQESRGDASPKSLKQHNENYSEDLGSPASANFLGQDENNLINVTA